MGEKMLVLSWKYHNVTFSNIISKFRDKGNYSDVTLSCEGKFYPAHKLVLAACSEYFEDMFQHTACNHPIVVLKDITAKNLEALLSYMYSGVANISQDDLANLIRAAESLCIKGLAVPDDTVSDATEPPAPVSTAPDTVKSKRRKKDRCGNAPSFQDYSETKERSAVEDQDDDNDPEVIRGTGNSNSASQSSLFSLDTSLAAHNSTRALECTPEISLKDPNDDVVVKEEFCESASSLYHDDPMDFGQDRPITAPNTGVVEGGGSITHQDYLCPMEAGSRAVGVLQHQQPPPLQQQLTEADMAGSSGISQSLHESDGCYDGLPNLEGLNCEGQMELYNAFNLQVSQFHLPEPGVEGNRRGKASKLAGSSGRGGKRRSIKVHRCSHCSYSTPWHSVFVRHCRTHSGEKPFTCSFCSFRSSRKSVIKRHCISKHS